MADGTEQQDGVDILNQFKILVTAFMVASIALAIAPVFGDFPENFDGYPNGTVSPATPNNPWICSVDGNTTCGSGSGYAPCFANSGVLYIGGAPSAVYSIPNVYQENVLATGCGTGGRTAFTGTHYVNITASFNVTQIGPLFSFFRLATVSTANINSTIYLCGTKIFSELHSTAPSTFTKLTQTSAVANIGATCKLTIKTSPVHGASATAGAYRFDNVVVKNANAIMKSANFVTFDQRTGSWFNMSNYANSFVQVNFGSGPPVTYTTPGFGGLYAPDMVLTTTGATSITVDVGGRTENSIFYPGYSTQMLIPTAGCTIASKCEIYLADPATPVFAYAFSITDLSGKFPSNSTATITQGTHLYSSGLTDQLGYAASLVPGKYTFTLTNGANTYSTLINLPAQNGYTQPIQILKLTVQGTCGPACTIGYNAAFNQAGTSVVVVFNDTALGTNRVTVALEKQNATGLYELSNSVFTGTYGALQTSIACNTSQCNTTLASQLYVALGWAGTDGSGTANIPVSGQAWLPTPNIPGCILQWCVTFPSITPVSFIGYGLVLGFAAIFGAFSAKFGTVVVSVLTGGLIYFGWIPLAPGVVTLIIAMGLTSFIAYLAAQR